MPRTLIAIGLGLLLAAGCAGERYPLQFEDLPGKRVLKPTDVVDVALAESDRNRIDTFTAVYEPQHRSVYTGPAWASVFRGDPATRPVFAIQTSALLNDTVGEGIARRVTYVADGTLSFGGRDYPIHAQGREVTSQDFTRAIPSAVGKCILDAAHQAEKVIAAGTGGH